MKRKIALLALAAVFLAAEARADSFVKTIASELDAGTVIPLQGNVDRDLAENLLYAQTQASYASPLSLELSIESVLKAISIYTFPGGPTVITDNNAPIVWIQSTIATNPDATVSITPTSINFGDVPVSTVEPGALLLLISGLGLVRILSRR